MISMLIRLGLLALFITALSGCSGSDGAAGPAGTNGTSVAVNAATMSQTEWANSQFSGQATGVTIGTDGKPVVNFKVVDKDGNPVTGLGNSSMASTAIAPSLTNLSFAFGKLVPGDSTRTNTWESPTRWVSYIVTSMPTKCTTAAGCTQAGYGTVPFGGTTFVTPAKPSTDNTGTLVDHGDGTYTYTFYRSITAAKSTIDGLAASAVAANANNKVADLGDLTYDANLTHRVGIHISGAARGTGSNTADGVTVIPAVNLKTPANVFYDFVPATGAIVADTETDNAKARNLVDVKNCFGCHSKFTFHGGNALSGVGGARQDTKMCVLCHTDQRKYSVAEMTVNTSTWTVSSGDRMNGASIKNLPVWIHKIHMGENLIFQGYNASNVLLNETLFPQDLRNCAKCHSNASQADNWKNKPSRLACGACHDGIDFATGTGRTQNGVNTSHLGGAQTNDANCQTCHQPATITAQHVPVSPIDPTWTVAGHTNSSAIMGYNSTNPATGALKISYDLNSVTLNASAKPVLKFRFMNNSVSPAAPVVFNAAPATAPTAADIAANNVVQLMPNFVGGPNAYIMAALPIDGNAKPADFNVSASTYIPNCWNKVTAATTCTMTGPDVNGYYTLTMVNVTVPATATMITGGIGFNDGAGTGNMPLTQTNVAGYSIQTVDASGVPSTTNVKGYKGGLNVPATPATKLVSGTLPGGFGTQTARRTAVEKARCDNCHNSLGTFTTASFHGGQRNDPDRCVLCHNPDLNNNGWSVSSNAHVHAIHSQAKRTADNGPKFTWASTDTNADGVADAGFFDIGYPGILRNCQQCHAPNTVNFGNSANATQANNLQFRTVATGAIPTLTNGVPNNHSKAPYVAPGSYGTKFSASLTTGVVTQPTGATLVNSPILNACFSCHTGNTAINHMKANGGTFYTPRYVVAGFADAATYDAAASGVAGGLTLNNSEQCLVCHGAGRVADVEAVHAQTMK